MLFLREKHLHMLSRSQLKTIEQELLQQAHKVRDRIKRLERLDRFEREFHERQLRLMANVPWKARAEGRFKLSIEIMRKAARGWSNKEIAASLKKPLHPDTISRIIRRELDGDKR